MKTLFTKAKTTAARGVLFAIGCVMAAVGLAAMSFLALLALSAIGLALLAAPFGAMAQTRGAGARDGVDAKADLNVDAEPVV